MQLNYPSNTEWVIMAIFIKSNVVLVHKS